MAYGRRRYQHPTTAARLERERQEQARYERNRIKLARLLKQYRQVLIKDKDEAQAAWGQPQLRSYTIGKDSGGTPIANIIRGSGGRLYLQAPHFPGWRFYRLVPRYQTPRQSEEAERDARRRAKGRDPSSRPCATFEESARYRVGYLLRGKRKFHDEPLPLEKAKALMRYYKRQGYTAWVADDRKRFVPVPGATREPGYLGDD